MTDEQLKTSAEKVNATPVETTDDAEKQLLQTYKKTFIGTFSHSLDNKGRLIVPLAFREQLGDTFFIGPSFDFKAIALYPTLVWAKMREQYAQLSAFDSRLKRYLAQFDALSYRDQECDNQGRLLLPSRIRQRLLGEDKDVDVCGAHDHVRIIVRQKNEDDFEDFMDNIEDIQDRISELAKLQLGS